jgi:Zn-dependent protease with chaperone function
MRVQPMPLQHFYAAGHLMLAFYGFSTVIFALFENVLRTAGDEMPPTNLMLIALGLSFFGGAASYYEANRHSPEPATFNGVLRYALTSTVLATIVGLFAHGYISISWWFGTILAVSFFQNVALALIPRFMKAKVTQLIHLTTDTVDTVEHKTETTTKTIT